MLFDKNIDEILDDTNIYSNYSKLDYYNYIVDKIHNNINLTLEEKHFLWNNYKQYWPYTKDQLRTLLREYKEKNVFNYNFINTSYIENMEYMFQMWDANIDISEWDVSNVKNMQYMFAHNSLFNCDLSKWDVSNVKHMNSMFHDCRLFNSDLSRWNISNVIDMTYMFYNCKSLDFNIKNWDVSYYARTDNILEGADKMTIQNIYPTYKRTCGYLMTTL